MLILNLLYTLNRHELESQMSIPLLRYNVPFSVAYGLSENSTVPYIIYNGKRYDFSGYALPSQNSLRVMNSEENKEFKYPFPWNPVETNTLPMPTGPGPYEALVGPINPKDPSWFQGEYGPLAKTPVYTGADGQSLAVITWLKADPHYAAPRTKFDIWENANGRPRVDDGHLRNQIPASALEMVSNLDYSDLASVTKSMAILAQFNFNEAITQFHPTADSNLTPLLIEKVQGKSGAVQALVSSEICRLGSNKKEATDAAFEIANSVINDPGFWSQHLPQTVIDFSSPSRFNPMTGRTEYLNVGWFSSLLDLAAKIKVHDIQAMYVSALTNGPSVYKPQVYRQLISTFQTYWTRHPHMNRVARVQEAWYLEGLVRLGCPKLSSQVKPVGADVLTQPESGFQECNLALNHWLAILNQI